jgi:succinate dehydrogenase / fumarate reductase cytochrome b subunit
VALRTDVLDRSRGGIWAWFGQRVTAVLVFVTVGVHLILTHYVAMGELSYADIQQRLGIAAVLVNDLVLLLAVVFHALNGVRMVVLDYWSPDPRVRRVFDVALWLAGLLASVYGIWALWVWVS